MIYKQFKCQLLNALIVLMVENDIREFSLNTISIFDKSLIKYEKLIYDNNNLYLVNDIDGNYVDIINLNDEQIFNVFEYIYEHIFKSKKY